MRVANPAREIIERRHSLAKMIGILGPCSFADCDDFADYTCSWKNKCRLSKGGCQEIYCTAHSYTPEGAPEPACCEDCEQSFKGDKTRVKAIVCLTISILLVALVTVILLFTVIVQGDSSDSNDISAPNSATSNAQSIFDQLEYSDIRVFSEALGFEMVREINAKRISEG